MGDANEPDSLAAQHGPVSAKIRNLTQYNALKPAEAAVAAIIMEAPDKVVHGSIEELSHRAKVSTTSVIRFCRALGYQGFKDFKIALALEVRSMPAALEEAISLEDSPMTVMRKVFRSEMQALNDTLHLMEEVAVEQAVNLLLEAKRIDIYGMGSSFPIVVDAYYRFLRIGLRVSTPPDSHMQAVNASLLDTGDVAIIVSHTGRTQEIITAASIARRAGAKVIVLTSFSKSPLIEHADVLLVTAVKETAIRVEAMASRLAHLAVIDALYVALASRRAESATATLAKTKRAIDEQRSDYDGDATPT